MLKNCAWGFWGGAQKLCLGLLGCRNERRERTRLPNWGSREESIPKCTGPFGNLARGRAEAMGECCLRLTAPGPLPPLI